MVGTVVGDGGVVLGAPGGRRTVGALAVAGASLIAYAVSPGLVTDLRGFADLVGGVSATGFEDFVLSFGVLSPIVYFFAMVAQVFVAPIPSGPFSLAGALIFGVWEGLALGLAGSVVGSVLVFLAVRRWGEPLVARMVGREVYEKYVGVLDRRGWWLLAVLLVPFLPDDAVVALAGLSALSLRRFLAVLVLGRVPGSVVTALLAFDRVTGSTAAWVAAGVVIVAILALGLACRERLEIRLLRRAVAGDGERDAGKTESIARGGDASGETTMRREEPCDR